MRSLGSAVDWFRSGALADDALRAAPYDAVVLDLGLPGGDGLDWLRRWRGRAETVPVLILTARDAVADRIAGLDSGADRIAGVDVGPASATARRLDAFPGRRCRPGQAPSPALDEAPRTTVSAPATSEERSARFAGTISVLPCLAISPKACTYCSATFRFTASSPPG